MEQGKIIVIDDYASVRVLVEAALAGSSHEVVAGAHTLEEAVTCIATARRLGANVFLLDANLESGHQDGMDALEILDAIDAARSRDATFRPVIIGISNEPFRRYGLETRVDADITKDGIALRLEQTLDGL